MKTLLFCNLIPLKTGAFETLLAAIGAEFKRSGDDYVVVFAGEPIPPVADSLRDAGVRWCILEGWVDREAKERGAPVVTGVSPVVSVAGKDAADTAATTTGERVHPWLFVLPAVRLIHLERPDVVAVHFGNEMPTLVASLLCKVTMKSPPHWVWEQDQQIQDPGKIGRWFSKIRLLGLGVDQYLAVYEGGRQSMLKRGIPREKITIIHNSVAPYTPTRPKGWLRQELKKGKCEEKSISREAPSTGSGQAAKNANKEGPPASVWGGCPHPPCSGRTREADEDIRPTPEPRFSGETPGVHSPGVAPDEVLLVTNGSLIPRKRIDFILKACALLCGKELLSCSVDKLSSESPAGSLPSTTQQPNNLTTKKPPWRLLVIGDGPERERLGALATALGIADRVHFLGLRNDVREILPECDIYLHASKAETCTYAVTESMAAGIPAVMLNAGAAKEQIENGKTGFVFDAVDPLSFAACLRDVMGNPRCRAEMGRLAKSRWEGLFLVERAAERYHELYAKMVERLHR